jgi:hypothetical protein
MSIPPETCLFFLGARRLGAISIIAIGQNSKYDCPDPEARFYRPDCDCGAATLRAAKAKMSQPGRVMFIVLETRIGDLAPGKEKTERAWIS